MSEYAVEKIYIVYKQIFHDNKVYIGMTRQNLYRRQKGINFRYKGQSQVWEVIKRFRQKGVECKIITLGLLYTSAKEVLSLC